MTLETEQGDKQTLAIEEGKRENTEEQKIKIFLKVKLFNLLQTSL